jgi:hypothetical protein
MASALSKQRAQVGQPLVTTLSLTMYVHGMSFGLPLMCLLLFFPFAKKDWPAGKITIEDGPI